MLETQVRFPRLGRSPGEDNGHHLQFSCSGICGQKSLSGYRLGMQSWTQLSNWYTYILGAWMLINIISSSWLIPLLYNAFMAFCHRLLFKVFSVTYFTPQYLLVPFVEKLFPSPHFQSLCVFSSEVSFLQLNIDESCFSSN